MAALLDQATIDDELAGRDTGWTGTPERLARSIEFADFLTAVDFIVRLAPRCEELDHHPDLDLRWRRVDVALTSHSAGGVTSKDLELAAVIDDIIAGPPGI